MDNFKPVDWYMHVTKFRTTPKSQHADPEASVSFVVHYTPFSKVAEFRLREHAMEFAAMKNADNERRMARHAKQRAEFYGK